jgi:hypothetical protein
MNRCKFAISNFRFFAMLTALTLSIAPGTALSQMAGRPIPLQAQRGTLLVTDPPNIVLNGKPERLSPGARIRGANNLLVLSGTLVGQALSVRYLREPQGQIHEVWILTAAEAQQ